MNKVILSGNLTRDPEVRYSQSGTAFARTGIAVSRASKSADGQSMADFFNITIFGKQAEFCGRYMKKGSSVLLEGRVENDNYEDKNGVKHYSVNILVERIEFSGSKRRDNDNANTGGGNYPPDNETGPDGDIPDDVEVPF